MRHGFYLLSICLFLSLPGSGQKRYVRETNLFLRDVLYDTTGLPEYAFARNTWFDPPDLQSSSYLIDREKLFYLQLFTEKTFWGISNPFYGESTKNEEAYFQALTTFRIDTLLIPVKRFDRQDRRRIFDVHYPEEQRDSSGRLIRSHSPTENDSIFKTQMTRAWETFRREFGHSYIIYYIPVFTDDFKHAFFECVFVSETDPKRFYGFFQKKGGRWKPLKLVVKP